MASLKDENVTLYPRGAEVSTGPDDAHDGVKLGLDGEPFWRVHITPQGRLLTGSGFSPPTDYGVAAAAQTLFIQPTAPVTAQPQYEWWETTAVGGDLVTLWVST